MNWPSMIIFARNIWSKIVSFSSGDPYILAVVPCNYFGSSSFGDSRKSEIRYTEILSSLSKYLLSEIYFWNACHRLSLGCDLPVILYCLCWVGGGLLSINFKNRVFLSDWIPIIVYTCQFMLIFQTQTPGPTFLLVSPPLLHDWS